MWFLKSKTLMSNLIVIVFALLSQVLGITIPEEWHNKVLDFLLAPQTQLILLAIYNVILRFFTKIPVKEK